MSSQSRSAAVSGRLIGALRRDQEVDDPASGVGPPLLEVLVQSGDLVVARRGGRVNLIWPQGDGLIWPHLLLGRG